MPKCKSCHDELPETDFPISNKYEKKNGSLSITRRKVCKACYAGKRRERCRAREHEEFNRLVGWPVTMLTMLLTVTAIYSHDYVRGTNRVCTYESVYGHHAVTIDAMRMCPLTWEFEV